MNTQQATDLPHTHCCTAQVKASSSPAEDTKVSGAEREYVMANTVSSATSTTVEEGGGGHFAAPSGNATEIPWKLLLSRKEVGVRIGDGW